jgi:hypothetical protein
VQEISRNAVFVLDEKKQIKQILDFKKEQDEGIIPFCIDELKKLNEKLEDYSPSNPELAELDVREVVFRLALEMHRQNQALMTALKHLAGKEDEITFTQNTLDHLDILNNYMGNIGKSEVLKQLINEQMRKVESPSKYGKFHVEEFYRKN